MVERPPEAGAWADLAADRILRCTATGSSTGATSSYNMLASCYLCLKLSCYMLGSNVNYTMLSLAVQMQAIVLQRLSLLQWT
jgi:hypothetical protein